MRCPWCYAISALAYSDGERVTFCDTDQSLQTFVHAVESAGGTVAIDLSLNELLGLDQPPERRTVRWCREPSAHRWELYPWQRQQLARSRARMTTRPHRLGE